jgi:hypothetical protein
MLDRKNPAHTLVSVMSVSMFSFLEESRLLGCGAVLILCEPTFRKDIWSPSSGSKNPRARIFYTLKMETIIFDLVCEAIGTAATPGLLCQLRVIVTMIVEKQMECRLAGDTEVLGENLPQRHFCPSQNPT